LHLPGLSLKPGKIQITAARCLRFFEQLDLLLNLSHLLSTELRHVADLLLPGRLGIVHALLEGFDLFFEPSLLHLQVVQHVSDVVTSNEIAKALSDYNSDCCCGLAHSATLHRGSEDGLNLRGGRLAHVVVPLARRQAHHRSAPANAETRTSAISLRNRKKQAVHTPI
jgi:hypothetical protein